VDIAHVEPLGDRRRGGHDVPMAKSSTDFMLDASPNDLSVSFHTKF
jgi:hypothetical protein